ncbi:MAG TPA: hypothetical protein VGF67_20985 [Ktedonobacteraceae bacterium]|jgi:hypothetical protein
MTSDRPLPREELEAVSELSSHIDVSSTHAVVEYHWGDFKHDPMRVLHDFFDGFLYWANWGAPQLALRFPHGVLPAGLLDGYDCDEFATFTRHKKYDILDICFGEMEAPDEWVDYELGSLMPLRNELMEGDLRALYITWLASQVMLAGYDDAEEEEEEEEEVSVPPVPPHLGALTAAQQALAELLRVPEELLAAAAQHSRADKAEPADRFAAWLDLLPAPRQREYLLRLARNEPGLSHLLVGELRELGQQMGRAQQAQGERVPYATLLTESKALRRQLEQERQKQEQQALLRRLQEIHDHAQRYWQQAEQAAARGTGSAYDEATRLLVDLRDAARSFHEDEKFQEDFLAWVRPHLRRPALLNRLQEKRFPVPQQ